MALISDLPNATPQKSDLMEIQNGQTSSNNSSVGQLMQLSASENLAPAYDANAGVYVVGDFASYDGTLYQCNTAIVTPEAFDATKWDAVKVTEISSGASVVQLTQAEYTALSTAEKMNGSIYKITDNAKMYCLNKAYHPVEECTVAEYNQKTSAQQNDGTIYIQTDAETTGEDIKVSSTDTRTIDEGIADAEGQEIPYATWQTMTPQEQADAGKVYVPDFPTATPNATEIPMSSSESTSVAAAMMYHVGDNVFISGIVSAGYLTSSAKSLRFYIPLNKPFNQIGVRNISLNDITMAIRMIDGSYLLNNARLSTISNSIRVYSNGMGLYVQAAVDAASNLNNTPCVVQIMEYEQNIVTLA